MRKAPTIFLLVISLLWHTFALAQSGFAYDHAEGFAHVALHLEKEAHHHHDDGSFHQDESHESIQHVYADNCANATGVIPDHAISGVVAVISTARSPAAPPPHDSPILEGLRRPPRLTT